MGLIKRFGCPVPDCSYSTIFRLGMGEEIDAHAHAEREGWLRDEHPDHPATETPWSTLAGPPSLS